MLLTQQPRASIVHSALPKAWHWDPEESHHTLVFPHVHSLSNLLFTAAGSDTSAFCSLALLGSQWYL